jgi:hypothetical protein
MLSLVDEREAVGGRCRYPFPNPGRYISPVRETRLITYNESCIDVEDEYFVVFECLCGHLALERACAKAVAVS